MLNPEFRTFFKKLSLGTLILTVLFSPLLYFNLIIDPYGVFFDHCEYIYSTNENNKRQGKIRYLLRYPDLFDSFIFGSSRVNFINPDLARDGKFFNMTYSVGAPADHLRDLKMMIRGGVKVKKVLIGVDYMSFFFEGAIRLEELLRLPHPVTFREYYDFYKQYLLLVPQKELLKAVLPDHQMNREELIGNGSIRPNKNDTFFRKDPLSYIRHMKFRIPTSQYQNPQHFQSGLNGLRDLIQFLKAQNIEYEVFIHPTHVTTYLTLNLPAYFDLMQQMSEFTDYWDFSGLNSICINNLHFFETSHFCYNTGDMILSRLYGEKFTELPDDFGYLISKKNITEHLGRHRKWISDYFKCLNLNQQGWQFSDVNPAQIVQSNSFEPILKIDGLSVDQRKDTLLAAAPYMRVTIRKPEGPNMIPVIMTDQKGVISCPADFCRPSGDGEWELLIPGQMLDNDYHTLSVAYKDTVTGFYYTGCSPVNIRVLNPLDYNPDVQSLQEQGEHTEQHIDFQLLSVDGQWSGREKFTVSADLLNISGWAIQSKTKDAVQNLAITVGDQVYPITIINEQPELDQKFNYQGSRFGGWSVTVPLPLVDQVIPIEFGILSGIGKPIKKIGHGISVYRQLACDTTVLSGKKKMENATDYHIDLFNGRRTGSQSIVIREKIITLAGWAVDKEAKKTASGVFIRIGDKLFKADYGMKRQDVANVHKTASYADCGWFCEIPVHFTGKGKFPLTLIILTSDGEGFYVANQGRNLVIE